MGKQWKEVGKLGQGVSGKENGQCRDARAGVGTSAGEVQEAGPGPYRSLKGSGFYSGDTLEGFAKAT